MYSYLAYLFKYTVIKATVLGLQRANFSLQLFGVNQPNRSVVSERVDHIKYQTTGMRSGKYKQ